MCQSVQIKHDDAVLILKSLFTSGSSKCYVKFVIVGLNIDYRISEVIHSSEK